MDTEHTHDLENTKVNGEEQTVADEITAAFGEVEHKMGQVIGDDLMDQSGDKKIVDHGSIEDVAEAIEDHASEKSGDVEEQ